MTQVYAFYQPRRSLPPDGKGLFFAVEDAEQLLDAVTCIKVQRAELEGGRGIERCAFHEGIEPHAGQRSANLGQVEAIKRAVGKQRIEQNAACNHVDVGETLRTQR